MAGCLNLPSGIKDIESTAFHLYPNPAQDEIMISIDGSLIGVSLSISDINGRNILSRQLNSADNKMSVSELANGIYLLTISQNGQQAVSRKLVITR